MMNLEVSRGSRVFTYQFDVPTVVVVTQYIPQQTYKSILNQLD